MSYELHWTDAVASFSSDPRWSRATKGLSESELKQSISLPRMWECLDLAWNEIVQRVLSPSDRLDAEFEELLIKYYEHPVWLLNGAFTESDAASVADRLAAVRLISHVSPHRILDFGGGCGTAARLCAQTLPCSQQIDLVDVSAFRETVRDRLRAFAQIRVLEKAEPSYDAIICTEVLEHLTDPISAVCEMNRLLRIGGALAASWSFAPGIHCHLPHNFHLRHIMPWVVRALGFGFYGFERRGSTVFSFVKHSELTPTMISQAQYIAAFGKIPLPFDRILLALRGM